MVQVVKKPPVLPNKQTPVVFFVDIFVANKLGRALAGLVEKHQQSLSSHLPIQAPHRHGGDTRIAWRLKVRCHLKIPGFNKHKMLRCNETVGPKQPT